ncbi:Homeobox protein homothorax [Papilio xuthus]|uniref:Homeobox protein homothorax n=1 Tax=Papilio xuthus TaxID=66420 RepID=A0A194PFM4_PAPXU|nr:Homeobox protein homothorax [Papilio xuthus]
MAQERAMPVTCRPPSSSLSYGGAATDDVRSPGSGGTPGPLGQPPPQTLDATDPDTRAALSGSLGASLAASWLERLSSVSRMHVND